jgi:hypothetical protein
MDQIYYKTIGWIIQRLMAQFDRQYVLSERLLVANVLIDIRKCKVHVRYVLFVI